MILTVNAGSSSLRAALFDERLQRVAGERFDTRDPAQALRAFLAKHDAQGLRAAVHRVVHGGSLVQTTRIDREAEAQMERMARFAPLHNPPALECIRAVRALRADLPQWAVFDTAFFADLPEAAATYALPLELSREHGLRRYGFHGIAHRSMWRRWCELRPDLAAGGRLITLQLGSGASITAVREGRPLDTSMGFSPMEGLVMATRSGDVDAGVLLFLQRTLAWDADRVEDLLIRRSGLLGVSGLSGDMRVLLASDDPRARLAVELYCRRARKYLGAFLAVLGGADGIVFGGGVGEGAAPVRERILAGLEWAGIVLDPARNERAAVQPNDKASAARISAPEAGVAVWVLAVDEEAELAREGGRVLQLQEQSP